jgi:hypothetical protein
MDYAVISDSTNKFGLKGRWVGGMKNKTSTITIRESERGGEKGDPMHNKY